MKGKRMFFAGAVVGAALMVSVSAAADSLSLIGKKSNFRNRSISRWKAV